MSQDTPKRKALTDIIYGDDREELDNAWQRTQAADDYSPLPRGVYEAHIIAGALFTSSSKNTPGYKLTFEVCVGEQTGRRFFADCWLTPLALPMTKRDLGKLGLTDLAQLEQPIPRGIRVKAQVACRVDDDGVEYNRVRKFEVIRIDKVPDDPFAPDEDTEAADKAAADEGKDKAAPNGGDDGDPSFEFGANTPHSTKSAFIAAETGAA